MKRRELIKGFAALGAMALLPDIVAMGDQTNSNLHFVGLGAGGTNAMVHIHGKGIKAQYSCITGPYVSHLAPEMEHIFFVPSPDCVVGGIHYKERIALTPRMNAIFNKKDRFVILAGLGASVGTSLISNVIDLLQAGNKSYLVICSMPGINEGRERREYAKQKRMELEGLNNVLYFDHESINEEFGRLPIRKTFRRGDELFYTIFKNNFSHIVDQSRLN
jgi:cell division GTPase FtsZ